MSRTIKTVNGPIDLLVVCGPTASGKTHLGVQLATHVHGEIISADARQVYKKMSLGTGKDLFEYQTPDGTIPYHLIDIAEPEEIYTLYHFQQDCYQAIKDIRQKGSFPIIVGGTGLYIESVLKNYQIPSVPENHVFRQKMQSMSQEYLKEKLNVTDKDLYEKTDCSSKKRIIRALEIAEYAQNHTLAWGMKNPPHLLNPLVLCTSWDRHLLYERIYHRLIQRLKEGMIDEVAQLISSPIPPERFDLFGMEYKFIKKYLLNEITYEHMIDSLAKAIRHLAKRQITWFRGMPRRHIPVHWIENASYEKALQLLSA